jgi:hypothetical protein
MTIRQVILDHTIEFTPAPEPQAELALDSASYFGDENTQIVFTITRTVRTDQVVDIDWGITNATVTPTSGTERFQIGEMTKNIGVQAGDLNTNESGNITLANPVLISGPNFAPILGNQSSATLFITDLDVTRNVIHTVNFETGQMVDDRFWPAPDSMGNKCFNKVGDFANIVSVVKGSPTVITVDVYNGWLDDADGEDSPDGVILRNLTGDWAVWNDQLVRTRNQSNGGLTIELWFDHFIPGYMADGQGLETSVDDMGKNPLVTTGFDDGWQGGQIEGIFRRIEQLADISVGSNTDQEVIIAGNNVVGADVNVPARALNGTRMLKDTIWYHKPYDINGRVSTGNLKGGNSGHNKPRSQLTPPGESEIDSDSVTRGGLSIYLPSDYADENGTDSGDSRNMFLVMGIDGGGKGMGNFGVGNPGGDIPTTDLLGNPTPGEAGNVWVWRERFNPLGFDSSNSSNPQTVWWHNLGEIAGDKGLWTDFVFEWIWNPMSVTAAPSTILAGGSTRVHQAFNGRFKIWKSTGPYIDGTQDRKMTLIFDHEIHQLDHPFQTGTLPEDGNDTVRFEPRQYRFGWHRNPTSTTEPVTILWDEIRWGGETQNGTFYPDVHPSGQSVPATKKWNPGHYIKTQGDPTGTDTASYWSGVQSTITSRMSDIPEILGAFVAISPGMVNTAPGVYDWTDLDATLAQIVAAGDRRIIIDLTWKSFNDATPGLHAPPDLSSEIELAGTGWIWAVWRESNMDRLIEIYDALAARYDSHANVELITSAETAPSFQGSQPGDYSVSKYITQLKRLYRANALAFDQTIWAPNMNSLGGTDMDELFEYMYQTCGAVAFPDWGKGRAAFLFDGTNTSTVVDREFRGQIAAHGIVSTNKLNDSGVTPSSIFTEQLTHQATHFSWITSASGEDSWTNIKAAIQANEPGGVVTACPTRFGGCT